MTNCLTGFHPHNYIGGPFMFPPRRPHRRMRYVEHLKSTRFAAASPHPNTWLGGAKIVSLSVHEHDGMHEREVEAA